MVRLRRLHAHTRFLHIWCVVLAFMIHNPCHIAEAAHPARKTYIVHTLRPSATASTGFSTPTEWYQSLLHSVHTNTSNVIYTYQNVLQGFATRLSTTEAEQLRGVPGVLAVLPEVVYKLHTTHTPDFLGLNSTTGLLPESKQGTDIIIGMLDSGVWPESKCFDDAGLGPIPVKWKGECSNGTNFNASNCNRKLIGAQFFYLGYEAAKGPINGRTESWSPRDDIGHGTHTACTAGGSVVSNASFFGRYAAGVARGMAAHARIAAYKVCWGSGYCYDSDILSGMDKAIDDGVDVLSVSLGGYFPVDFYRDGIAVGAFQAVQRGVFVSSSAGNSGPRPFSVTNVAPWLMTVAASTVDRDFPGYLFLGNGKKYPGVSVFSGEVLPNNTAFPLIYAANATYSFLGKYCYQGYLTPSLVAGKIVICDSDYDNSWVDMGIAVQAAGGVGMIINNQELNGYELLALAHVLPTLQLGPNSSAEVIQYAISAPNPNATLVSTGTKLGVEPSPVMAGFSSRGPNTIAPWIMKPDVTAPGVNIIAAWSGGAPPSSLSNDNRRVDFNIISGTSMSCPHVSGIAALLKAAHPDWSPSAIKSALMTTAYSSYRNGTSLFDSGAGWKQATPFAYGAGHIDPQRALDPGLVYLISADEYLDFLCDIGYTEAQIAIVAGRNYTCTGEVAGKSLNYPAFVVRFNVEAQETVNVTRTLTNVGDPNSTYSVSFEAPFHVEITVTPPVVHFNQKGDNQSYVVSFTSNSTTVGRYKFGHLEWSDVGQKHRVRSPIAFI